MMHSRECALSVCEGIGWQSLVVYFLSEIGGRWFDSSHSNRMLGRSQQVVAGHE